MGLVTGEYQVYGVPGRLRPLGPPTGAPGLCAGSFPLDPLFLGYETWRVAQDENECAVTGAWRPTRWAIFFGSYPSSLGGTDCLHLEPRGGGSSSQKSSPENWRIWHPYVVNSSLIAVLLPTPVLGTHPGDERP